MCQLKLQSAQLICSVLLSGQINSMHCRLPRVCMFTPDVLKKITAETLVVFGDREYFGAEPMYPVSLAFELHAGIPGSFLWVVPNGGHGPIFGPHAQTFAATAESFLRGAWRR